MTVILPFKLVTRMLPERVGKKNEKVRGAKKVIYVCYFSLSLSNKEEGIQLYEC